MPVSLLPADAERYLRDRAAKGFTAVIVNVLEALFTALAPPRTVDGIRRLIWPGDSRPPNETYFERIDGLLAAAARHGIEPTWRRCTWATSTPPTPASATPAARGMARRGGAQRRRRLGLRPLPAAGEMWTT
jgi:hypothetical protein